ncbi:MAG: AraC family transcriptional regulator, partial [Pseudomonadota bacterium]|nr:AraC family transcriptional regulator [Pseudomonadota bacterium]
MDQQVTKINIDNPTTLFGLKVRTCNMNEMSGEGAKIAGLWQQFYTDIAPNLTPSSQVYGFYTHYESDVTGEFDVLAFTDLQVTSSVIEQTTLATGNYLRF